ncbi:MAG: nickel pincer cofactor biosynthesis protein LarC [Phycisphaerae bacterium]|nr:nickel pincer cofactor biosynthesis protein LarC [Phycisphaerae bacterium]
MTLAYFDCFAGAGGDMIVAALLDAGADLEALKGHLARLDIGGCRMRTERVRRGGLGGLRFCVEAAAKPQADRNLADILALIDRAALPARAASRAKAIFTRLAEAEAKVHRIDTQEVHFHEVGAVDSIVDVVAAAVALELLNVDTVQCSPIPTGSGVITCSHGTMPVPAPATSELLIGVPLRPAEVTGEATTPTAAAVLTTLAESYGPLPPMQVSAVGWGAGTREGGALPNLLRVFLGQPAEAGSADAVVELAANIDDCTGQVLGATLEAVLAAVALDAWATSAVMKKSRPAWVLSVLCSPTDAGAMEDILFAQTTTFGVRRSTWTRSKLLRHHETVQTPYGAVRVKVGRRGEREITVSPEFDDCQAAAKAHGVAVRDVLAAAVAAYRQGSTP